MRWMLRLLLWLLWVLSPDPLPRRMSLLPQLVTLLCPHSWAAFLAASDLHRASIGAKQPTLQVGFR